MQVIKHKSKYHSLALSFPYNPDLVEKCRSIKEEVGWEAFGFDPPTKHWVFSIETLEKVLQVFPFAQIHLSIQKEFTDYMKEKQLLEEKYKRAEQGVKVEGLPLFPFQEKGVAFLTEFTHVLLADEMGLGKTIQALGSVKHNGFGHVLVVCPASLKDNWAREIKNWKVGNPAVDNFDYIVKHTDTYISGILKESKTFLPIFITNYERLDKIPKQQWDVVIFDEAHYLKNPKTKRSRLAKELVKNAKRVYALTGTPILNRPKEVIAQIDLLGKLKDFGGEWRFSMRYCDAKQDDWGHWDFGGASNLEELKEKLKSFTLRRTKNEVLKDLPDKLVTSKFLPHFNDGYEKLKKELKDDIIGGKQEYKEFYAATSGLTEVQKINYLEGLQKNERYKQLSANSLVMIEKLRAEAARQKVLQIVEILEEYVESGTKLVLFATHKETVAKIVDLVREKWGDIVVGMNGDTPVEHRQKIVQDFQEDQNILFFVGTIKTAGVGYTLTAASNVMFVELDWTPTLHQQAEDRCYRIGQKNNVLVTYLLLEDSIDEDIADMLLAKSEVIEGAIEGKVLQKFLAKIL